MSHMLLTKISQNVLNLVLAFVYFNDVKPPIYFRLTEGTPIDVLKSKLDNLLHHTDNRNGVKIEYY